MASSARNRRIEQTGNQPRRMVIHLRRLTPQHLHEDELHEPRDEKLAARPRLQRFHLILNRYISDLEADIAAHLVNEFPQQIGDELRRGAKPALAAHSSNGQEF
jgi:hypothetical protein